MGKDIIQEETTRVLQRIVKIRQELGVSQMDLAFKLHMTANGYFKIEKGHTNLSVIRLLEIAYVLEVCPNSFFKD